MRDLMDQCEEAVYSASFTEFSWYDLLYHPERVDRMLETFERATRYPGKSFKPSLYVIMDAVRVPAYIGKSTRIAGRLLDHVGRGSFNKNTPTAIGQYVIDHQPESLHWMIRCLDAPSMLEQAAIALYCPRFNVEFAPPDPILA